MRRRHAARATARPAAPWLQGRVKPPIRPEKGKINAELPDKLDNRSVMQFQGKAAPEEATELCEAWTFTNTRARRLSRVTCTLLNACWCNARG